MRGVLEPELTIFPIYNGYYYWGRPSVSDLSRDDGKSLKEVFAGVAG